jgi:hypothetical protein
MVEFSPHVDEEIGPILLNKIFVGYLPSTLNETMDILQIRDRTLGDTIEHDCWRWCRKVIDIIDDKHPANGEAKEERYSLYLLKLTSKHSHSLDFDGQAIKKKSLSKTQIENFCNG